MLVRLNDDGADRTATLLGVVAERTGLRRAELRLTYGGKQLMQGASLRQYGVQEGSTIQLLLRLRGGARAGVPGPRSLSKGVRVLSANVTALRRYADQMDQLHAATARTRTACSYAASAEGDGRRIDGALADARTASTLSSVRVREDVRLPPSAPSGGGHRSHWDQVRCFRSSHACACMSPTEVCGHPMDV